MKKIWLLFLAISMIFIISGCQKNDQPSETPSPTGDINNDFSLNSGDNSKYLTGENLLAKNVQDGVILHAWNWSYKTIKENLPDIARAGFSTVQTSPIVDTKAKKATGSWKNNWSKLYQPASLKIAQDGTLGTKEELKELCAEANKYGIKIICDMVLNHMANSSTGTDNAVTMQDYLYDEIKNYEKEIYDNAATYFRPKASGITQGWLNGDLPDLNTANEYIQERVSDLLKDAIDCGVSGFRFDAAKHIETPDDKQNASDFWKVILTNSSTYAKETYNRDMYYYGEILNGPEDGRDIGNYTKWMSVTDSGLSGNMNSALTAKNPEKVIATKDYSSYGSKITADKAVLWVESHDNYADGSTNKMSTLKINRIWGLTASRVGATSLYLARPSSDSTPMGTCDDYSWLNPEVISVNRFHNQFIGSEENITVQGGFAVNEQYRASDDKAGVIIVNAGNANNISDVNITVSHLKDGTYYDSITGNEFIVKNGNVSGQMGSTGVVVLYKKTYEKIESKPVISLTTNSYYLYENQELTVTLKASNANKIVYSFNDGEEKEITTIDRGIVTGSLTINGFGILKASAIGDVTTSASYEFKKAIKRDGYIGFFGISDETLLNCEIYAWVWSTSNKTYESHWIKLDFNSDGAYLAVGDFDSFLLATFPKGHTITKVNAWDNAALNQTNDFNNVDANIAYNSKL